MLVVRIASVFLLSFTLWAQQDCVNKEEKFQTLNIVTSSAAQSMILLHLSIIENYVGRTGVVKNYKQLDAAELEGLAKILEKVSSGLDSILGPNNMPQNKEEDLVQRFNKAFQEVFLVSKRQARKRVETLVANGLLDLKIEPTLNPVPNAPKAKE